MKPLQVGAFLISAVSATTSAFGQVEGKYTVLSADTMIFEETVSLHDGVLQTELLIPGQDMRFAGTTVYNGSLEPDTMEMDVYRISTGEMVQGFSVKFKPDSVTWVVTLAGAARGTIPLQRPRALMVNPVFGHTALVVMRAFRDSSYTHPQVFLQTGQSVVMPIVFRDRFHGTLTAGSVTVDFELDENGWMRHATVPIQGLEIVFEPTQ